jgi:hypothetical protein
MFESFLGTYALVWIHNKHAHEKVNTILIEAWNILPDVLLLVILELC